MSSLYYYNSLLYQCHCITNHSFLKICIYSFQPAGLKVIVLWMYKVPQAHLTQCHSACAVFLDLNKCHLVQCFLSAITMQQSWSVLCDIPWRIRAATPNHKLFNSVKLFSTTSEDGLQEWGLYHSYGVNLPRVEENSFTQGKKCRQHRRLGINTALEKLHVWQFLNCFRRTAKNVLATGHQ